MVISCCAYGCENRFSKQSNTSFHKFPLKSDELCKKWVVALRRKNFVPTKYSYVCSAHFVSEDYTGEKKASKPRLKDDAVPSVFTFPKHLTSTTRKRKSLKRKIELPAAEDKIIPIKMAKSLPATEVSPAKRKLHRKIKTLQQKVRRKESKIASLASVVKKLEDEKFIATDAANLLKQNFSGLKYELLQSELKNQYRAATGHRYTDEVKKFALTLHFYSPRAYDFVRTIFSLPCPSSLSNWTSSVNCEPGFFRDVFTYLQQKALEDESYKDCALIVDGMYIKSGVVYNRSTGKYDGFSDFGEDVLAFNADEIATEAVVFMLVGLRGHWKCPIGYVLCCGINASNLSSLISKALQLSSSHGLDVYSVTCDGTATNFDSMRNFGCEFGSKLSDIKGSFSSDYFNHALYFVADACHMLKLARNALADVKIFVDDSGKLIKWDHIKNLHRIQEDEGLKFGNRLSKSHIEYHRHKMNVKVAAQTLSSSVADSIEYLMMSGHPEFADAEGTIRFIRIVDRLFDLLNSRSPFGKGYRKPLFLHDHAMWKKIIKQSNDYLIKLRVTSGSLLITHRRKKFVLGFIIASKSIEELSLLLLKRLENPFKYVLTYKFSQDHLELLFACIRGKNGFNNNPDIIQLKSSLRKILLRNSIIGSKHANCLTFESSSAGSIFSLKWNKRNAPLSEKNDLTDDEKIFVKELSTKLSSCSISYYKEAILGYIAGFVVRKIVGKISCPECANALHFDSSKATIQDHHYSHFTGLPYLSLISLKNRGGLILPSKGVFQILVKSEKAFRVAVCGVDSRRPVISARKNLKSIMVNIIYQQLASDVIFPELNKHDLEHEILTEDLHSTQLIKKIIDKYVTIRLLTYGKHFNKDVLHKDKIGMRQQSTKLVIFKGI